MSSSIETKERLFKPALLEIFHHYSKEKFINDLLSGIIVGIVALPLAIAFGIASGVSPEKGILTAIIGGFIVSLLGGSRVQIGGPTGAFIVIVYGIIQDYGFEGLLISTVLAGFFLLLLGVLRLGTVIQFIPYPIIVGFTSGIAVTIFSTQVKEFLGLQINSLPGDMLGKWGAYINHIGTTSFVALGMGVSTILIIVLIKQFSSKIPGSMVALLLLTVIGYLFQRYLSLEVITIGDYYTFKASLPAPTPIPITFDKLQGLLLPSFTIAMLGAIESLLSASVADGAIGAKHHSNTELMAQGVANIIVPFFGGIPVTGAIARTMTNINNGGRSPVAGMIHAVMLLLILLFLGPLTSYIPLATLAGILMVVSYNMSEWRSFKAILKGPREDATVLLVTFFLTILLDLTIAIGVGIIIALLFLMKRVYKSSEVIRQNDRAVVLDNEYSAISSYMEAPEGVEIFEIQGPFFFGIANRFNEITKVISTPPKVRILRMRRVPFIDITGVHNLRILISDNQNMGIKVILSGVNEMVHKTLVKTGVSDIIGEENICSDITVALKKTETFLSSASFHIEK